MAKISPLTFLREVRSETARVSWPTRKETLITTAMVFMMALVASLFFFTMDQILGFGVSWLLTLGR